MRLTSPWWLIALPAAWAAVLLIVRHGRATVGRRQHRWAVAIRLTVVTLLGVSLAGPLWVRPVDEVSVFFVVDRSASIPTDARAAQDAYLAEALSDTGPQVRSGVLVFGADARVDVALRAGRTTAGISTVVDDSATDLASALRATGALLPTEGSRRVVVLTDAVPTTGDARLAATELAEAGVAVDVVVVSTGRGEDTLVEGVDLPASVREGDDVTATIRVRSNVAGRADLAVTTAAGEVVRLPVDLEVGSNTFDVTIPGGDVGVLTVEARIDRPGDTRPENDAAQGLTRVLGPATVAIVEGRAGEGQQLAAALLAGGIRSDLLAQVPDEAALLSYDAVILVNVPAPAEPVIEALASYVEDLGRGLLVIGGDRSYGMGGYGDTGLEDLLPVRSNPDDLVRRQPVAEVLVIDTSGSMGACHCGTGSGIEGGVNKTDISRAGAYQAIQALDDQDFVGVVTVSTGTDWVLPLGLKPTEDDARKALGGMSAEGNTEIVNGLRAALDELSGVNDALRHIVLFTDGWDPNDNGLLPIAREIADAGITLSVLGTGEGPGTTLQRMASVGGGRYYPGTDLQSIPDIFVEETLTVARNLIDEGVFQPVLAAPSQITASLDASPPLLGYVLTNPKGTASTPLLIGQNDPLLATWQRGLGRATAWTSDASPRWSAAWVEWDGYVAFWGAVVRDLLPAGVDSPPEIRMGEGQMSIRFEVEDAPLDAAAVARVRRPNGEVSVVPLQRTGTSTFVGSTATPAPGAYWVSVSVESAGAVLASGSGGAVSAYEEEFAFRSPDPTLAADLAASTRGRVDPPATAVFDPAPSIGGAETPLWPALTAVALALFLIDVALRRLVLQSGDVGAWKEAVTPRRRRADRPVFDPDAGEMRAPEPPPETDTVGRLLRRKNR